jgi:hypothetical protein
MFTPVLPAREEVWLGYTHPSVRATATAGRTSSGSFSSSGGSGDSITRRNPPIPNGCGTKQLERVHQKFWPAQHKPFSPPLFNDGLTPSSFRAIISRTFFPNPLNLRLNRYWPPYKPNTEAKNMLRPLSSHKYWSTPPTNTNFIKWHKSSAGSNRTSAFTWLKPLLCQNPICSLATNNARELSALSHPIKQVINTKVVTQEKQKPSPHFLCHVAMENRTEEKSEVNRLNYRSIQQQDTDFLSSEDSTNEYFDTGDHHDLFEEVPFPTTDEEVVGDLEALLAEEEIPSSTSSPHTEEGRPQDIPDVIITFPFVGDFRMPRRQLISTLFNLPRFGLKGIMRDFRTADHRLEFMAFNPTLASELIIALKKTCPILAFMAKVPEVELTTSVDFRLFRISFWGLPIKDTESVILAFLDEMPIFRGDGLLIKTIIRNRDHASQRGGVATLYYRLIPTFLFKPETPKTFKFSIYTLKWGFVVPPRYIKLKCRFCSARKQPPPCPHPSHLCFIQNKLAEKYPLSTEEKALSFFHQRKEEEIPQWIREYAKNKDKSEIIQTNPADLGDLFTPIDCLESFRNLTNPHGQGSESQPEDADLLAFFKLITPPPSAGSKRKINGRPINQ